MHHCRAGQVDDLTLLLNGLMVADTAAEVGAAKEDGVFDKPDGPRRQEEGEDVGEIGPPKALGGAASVGFHGGPVLLGLGLAIGIAGVLMVKNAGYDSTRTVGSAFIVGGFVWSAAGAIISAIRRRA